MTKVSRRLRVAANLAGCLEIVLEHVNGLQSAFDGIEKEQSRGVFIVRSLTLCGGEKFFRTSA